MPEGIHPAMRGKFDRDMELAIRARAAALAPIRFDRREPGAGEVLIEIEYCEQ